jgi:hypothetical protein
VGVATYDQLGHQGGVSQRKGNEQVHEKESRAAVTCSLCGKAPNIPQPDSTACRGHNKAKPGTEFASCGSHNTTLLVLFCRVPV